MNKVQDIINQLQLKPHPEGGYFKETYRSTGIIPQKCLDSEFIGDRTYCTGIYFLLTSDTFSAFHRINQDEMWHFYKGSPLTLHMISPEGDYSKISIGNDIENREMLQFVVPAKYWFAGEVSGEDSYALVGCTVAPGFDFRDFEMPSRENLISLFPQHSKIITRLTR
ncbi:cupin domain-containing protein [Hyunsoonleella flava]|uniref:Cupin domain-containing protein n=1 Tax=Hyunsoonleella flava TaxID=2527939 RepID=A0A4Q9FIG1_9FLAO|nr:cupin domain-containing protein [Hyunsoonleella flava]TBN04882.1 cupin domain-containing protein [Hyunsoonleella flava]